jgi:hypothetical protein
MGLTGHRDVVIGKAIDFTGHFFRSDYNEDTAVGADFLFPVLDTLAVHGQVDNHAPGFFPLPDASFPGNVVPDEKTAAPSIDYIGDALHHPLVISGKVHTVGPECPGSEPDMGGDPLVAFRPVPNPEDCQVCHSFLPFFQPDNPALEGYRRIRVVPGLALQDYLLDRENPASSDLMGDQHRLLKTPERSFDIISAAPDPAGEDRTALAWILDEEMVDRPVQVCIVHVYSFHEYQNIVFSTIQEEILFSMEDRDLGK